MIDPAIKEWIDNASYHTLLRRWRNAPAGGDPIFQDETGKYYSDVMFAKRDALEPGEAVNISKSIGW